MTALLELVPILRDPVDGGRLTLRDDALHREGDGRTYPVRDGVPVLLPPDSPFTAAAAGARAERERGLAAQTGAWLSRQRSRNLAAEHACSRLLTALRTSSSPAARRPRVLVVGGRVEGPGLHLLVEAADVDLIETDIALGPRTALLCDAHHLPFADGSIDAVVAQAVMEHVADPARVAAEVHRVLAPGGLVYSDTPFLQHVHEGAYDFTRFTLGGHRRLWHRFDELDAGVSGGPGMALAWAIRGTGRAMAGRSRIGRAAALVAASLAGAILTRLDPWLVRRPGAADAACATWFLGRRREAPLSDREIIARYDVAAD